MPKFRRGLSIFLIIWLCVMLITFTYTWVSRNKTPSIKSDDIDIASAGALIIRILPDTAPVYDEVSLNDVVGLDSFTFKQVSSQDGVNFFWKDFTPTIGDTGEPAVFHKITASDTHKKDYIDTQFCLQLDDSLETAKYVFIHPETAINYVKESINDRDLDKAIRISLTFEKEIEGQKVLQTVILGDIGDEENEGVINAYGSNSVSELYRAVLSDADGKTDREDSGALGYQTVYGLHYFNCGRTFFDMTDPDAPSNYEGFPKDESKTLFTLKPGEQKWVYMRVWLEGQDQNCEKEIAGDKFDFILKFDSIEVDK